LVEPEAGGEVRGLGHWGHGVSLFTKTGKPSVIVLCELDAWVKQNPGRLIDALALQGRFRGVRRKCINYPCPKI
jgi:hypothetical protein